LPLIDRDEPRFAQASREMLRGGDWLIPHFNDKPRYDKPPLIYWMQAGCYRVAGEGEFAARLPSALLAVAAAAMLWAWGDRLGGRGAGAWAAVVFSLALQTMVHAKAAVADMAVIAAMVGATVAGWAAVVRGTAPERCGCPCRAWWLFAAALGVGFLAKGPVAWLPVVPVVALAWRRGRAGYGLSRAGLSLVGALAIAAAWGLPALAATGGDFFRVGIGKHVVSRSFDAMEGHGAEGLLGYAATLPLYAATIFASFFPWSIRLPWMVREVRRGGRLPDDEFYLAWSFGVVFAVFTAVSTKLPHYILPGFPALALWMVLRWRRAGRPLEAFRGWAWAAVAINLFASYPGALFLRERVASYALFAAGRDRLGPGTVVALADFTEPSAIWLARGVVRDRVKFIDADEVAEFFAKKGPRAAVMTAELARAQGAALAGCERVEASGYNLVKGKPVALVLAVKPGR
jgi:4-amino-4-deoxy-L-arabinose transferase-like glycosyltransferase